MKSLAIGHKATGTFIKYSFGVVVSYTFYILGDYYALIL